MLLPQTRGRVMLNLNSCSFERNILIRTMSDADRDLLEPHVQPVELGCQSTIERAGRPIEKVIFPVSGVAFIIAGKGARRVEAGIFGREGMSGTAIITDCEQTPNATLMQIPGCGFQIDAGRMRSLLAESRSLQNHLLHFVQSLAGQTRQTALSNAHAHLDERLARSLLMCHDRIDGDEIRLTHEFLSIMLGVRRAGVTVGMHILEGKGLIRATRGCIRVLNRAALKDAAGGSYGVPEAEYGRLILGTERSPPAIVPPSAFPRAAKHAGNLVEGVDVSGAGRHGTVSLPFGVKPT